MKKTVLIVFIIVLVGGAFYFQSQLHLFPIFQKPCSQPITYSLGTFDNKFNISQTQFLSDLDKAVNIWDQPTGRVLFKYDPNGKLKVNLVYDYRQEATDKLKSLGYSIDNTQASYDSLKARYTSMTSDYNNLKQSLDTEVSNYNTQRQTYEQQVAYWNSQGGAPRNTANQLNAEAVQLNADAAKIKANQDTLNSLVNDINAMVDVLNQEAKSLNINVSDYNTIGASRGSEFEEGAYVTSATSQEIDIYEFQNEDSLVRVLAHELGHALGLQHINTDPQAIMYYLNQGTAEKATTADIAAVKQLCGIIN